MTQSMFKIPQAPNIIFSMGIFEQYCNLGEKKLGEATALPFEVYHSKEVFERELKSIFLNDWIFACHENELQSEGDFKCLEIGGESIVICRNKRGDISAFSNHCRHKGTKILNNGLGSTKNLVCPYHAWTYDLRGDLKGVPFSGKVSIEKKDHCLKKFAIEIWQGFVFLHLGEVKDSPAERFKGIEKYLAAFDTQRFKHAYSGPLESWDCNWKVAMENAMESYHLFAVHKETLEVNTPTRSAFYLEGGANWALTAGKIEGIKKGLFSDYPDYLNHYVLVSLPPSFVGILTYDSFDWIQVIPTSKDTIHVFSGGISPHSSPAPKDQKEFTEKFFEEDKNICELVQKSMNSQLSSGGLLVELERVVIDFRHYLCSRLFDKHSSHFISEEAKSFFNER